MTPYSVTRVFFCLVGRTTHCQAMHLQCMRCRRQGGKLTSSSRAATAAEYPGGGEAKEHTLDVSSEKKGSAAAAAAEEDKLTSERGRYHWRSLPYPPPAAWFPPPVKSQSDQREGSNSLHAPNERCLRNPAACWFGAGLPWSLRAAAAALRLLTGAKPDSTRLNLDAATY